MTPAYRLKPWNEVLRPHDDIMDGKLEMSTYAADLGAVDRGDLNTPRIYRDAREFFRTTYPTRNLRRLLADVLGAIAGGAGDRVVQLRTPFGGGKTHALLALYHLMRSRADIDSSGLEGLPDPGPGRVAILSGLDLDPVTPREVDGLKLHTLWGELAFRLGGQAAYEKVRQHDEEGKAPGGNVLRTVVGTGPVLILLDEVLFYVQRAGGKTGQDPQRRQVMLFLQGLTEVVRNLPNAAMVYSLQKSVDEAAGDAALLDDLDHLVTRVDAKREPVSDDEVMRVVQRRLFPTFGSDPEHVAVATAVAREYAIAYRHMRETFADTDADRRAAGQEAEKFEARVLESYPFHPALLDLMYHRWGGLPSYQRTRGALQFLASAVHAVWTGEQPAQPLLGPGDITLDTEQVRAAFFSQVGQREQYSSVLAADITGASARSAEVDRRIAADSPAYEQLRVGTRCATAIMLYSFGAREGEDKGVLESELVQAIVSPNLDRTVITTALHDLRDELLYLHHSGRRYRFETKANINKLIAEETRKWEPNEVLDRVKKAVANALEPAGDRAVLWPPDSGAIPDEPMFRIVYLGQAWTELSEPEISVRLAQLVDERSTSRRTYKNALAFAIPGQAALDRARGAARLLLALDSLLGQVKAKQIKIDKDQVDDLVERRRGTAADLSGAIDRLYERVLVPVPAQETGKPFAFDPVDLRAQLAAGRDLHTRILDGLRKHVFDSITPARLVALTRLGDSREYVAAEELVASFFSYFQFPKLTSERAIREAIARGVAEHFGYVSAAHIDGGSVVASRPELVRFERPLAADEVDLGPGCFLLSARLASALRATPHDDTPPPSPAPSGQERRDAEDTRPAGSESAHAATRYRLRFRSDASQLFRALPALQNLADKASLFLATVEVEVEGKEAFDRAWLRNAVEEHLDEAGLDAETTLY
ncbi:MAG: DUF499 domain-containing protein [Actinomycetota bacterium]|nr:DUF499 domain-containing protein [Actinomycetota bacterium]